MLSSRELPNPDLDPADRQKRLEGWNQERIRNSSVLVVGAGALGNEVIKNLVQLGVGKIYVVDFDEVVPANLNRCVLFRPEDAEERRKKVYAIAENVRRMVPYGYIEVVPIDGEIGGFDGAIKYDHPIYREAEVYFGALDNIISRIHLAIAGLMVQEYIKLALGLEEFLREGVWPMGKPRAHSAHLSLKAWSEALSVLVPL